MFTERATEDPKGHQAPVVIYVDEGCCLEVIKSEGALFLASSILVCIASAHRDEKQLQRTTVTPMLEVSKWRRKSRICTQLLRSEAWSFPYVYSKKI